MVSLNVPEASTATYASNPLPMAVIAGNAAHTSSEMPAKISFLRPVASMARVTPASSEALTDARSMIPLTRVASPSEGSVSRNLLSRFERDAGEDQLLASGRLDGTGHARV